MKHAVLKIHPKDNVIVALRDLKKGEVIQFDGQSIELIEDIPAKHKYYTADFSKNDEIIMYGVLVGKVTQDVKRGGLMTTQNLHHAAEPYAYRGNQYKWVAPNVDQWKQRTFMGYHREDGRVGTSNYWLFIPTVFCENRNLDVIREAMQNELGYGVTDKYVSFTRELVSEYRGEGRREKGQVIEGVSSQLSVNGQPSTMNRQPSTQNRIFKNVDGIKFLNHQGGCGGTRQDSEMLQNLLAAYADHPNVGGVTVMSLGCQHLQSNDFVAAIKKRNPSFDKPLFVFEQQGGMTEEELIKHAISSTFQGLVEINQQERKPATLDKLTVGVKCGGSDGFSGISANPAVGYFSDLLVALKGKILLAEFPELCGAEQELIDRSVNQSTAEKFIHLMNTYSAQAEMVGSGFHANPSPGNIRDGLITDAIKSAGACKKGGSSPVVDVLDYTEPASKAGLSLVCTPGNDVEATTGKAASGATLILFTTGLGTPTGNPVCPTIKLSTNTKLAHRMPDVIDIDCGPIVDGEKTIEQMGEEILEYCIKAASGEVIPKSVQLNQDDFIPWKRGVSL
ncbi:MAG: UxaA family hydrolase [Chitinophagaceae bacterium]